MYFSFECLITLAICYSQRERSIQRKNPPSFVSIIIVVLYRDKLKTPESIRKWIPVIKKEIDYCIQQVFYYYCS